ncbi:MAG: hypothetical protein KJ622_05300 [Alphaproteobacteria bacterium]|nr:hypothetical protein [Alphaproteobacteria bacterium]
MRLSTIALVLGLFAIGGHTYASLFSVTARSTSPAAWPTFVDTGRVIRSVSAPLADSPRMVERALAALPPGAAQPMQAVNAVVGRRATGTAVSGDARRSAAASVPPLPVKSPGLSKPQVSVRAMAAELPVLHARLVERPTTAAQAATPPRQPAHRAIVTGSLQRDAARAEPSQLGRTRPVGRTGAAFDLAARSSLGGPVPPAVVAPVRVAALVPPRAGGRPDQAALHDPQAPVIRIRLPEASPRRDLRKVGAGAPVKAAYPELRPLSHSLSVVRIAQPERLPASRSEPPKRTAALAPPLPPKAPGTTAIQRPPPDVVAARAENTLPALAMPVAPMRKASKTRRQQVRKRHARVRPVTRRAVKVSRRRAVRVSKTRRRSARKSRRYYASTAWKRKALGDSFY